MISEQIDDPDSGHPWKLPWYAAKTLDPEAAREIERHLETCPRCRDETRTWTAIGDALDERGEPPHIAWMDLIAFASGAPALDLEERARIETHVAGCPTCRRVLADLRELEDSPGSRQRNPWKVAFAMAAAACVLLAVVAGVALTRERDAPVKVEGGRRILLEPVYRGAPGKPSDPATVTEVHGQGPWCFTLLLADSAEAGEYRFQIQPAPRSTPPSSVGSITVDPDRVAVLWLRGPLEPGRYLIRLKPIANDDAEYSYEFVAIP